MLCKMVPIKWTRTTFKKRHSYLFCGHGAEMISNRSFSYIVCLGSVFSNSFSANIFTFVSNYSPAFIITASWSSRQRGSDVVRALFWLRTSPLWRNIPVLLQLTSLHLHPPRCFPFSFAAFEPILYSGQLIFWATDVLGNWKAPAYSSELFT